MRSWIFLKHKLLNSPWRLFDHFNSFSYSFSHQRPFAFALKDFTSAFLGQFSLFHPSLSLFPPSLSISHPFSLSHTRWRSLSRSFLPFVLTHTRTAPSIFFASSGFSRSQESFSLQNFHFSSFETNLSKSSKVLLWWIKRHWYTFVSDIDVGSRLVQVLKAFSSLHKFSKPFALSQSLSFSLLISSKTQIRKMPLRVVSNEGNISSQNRPKNEP